MIQSKKNNLNLFLMKEEFEIKSGMSMSAVERLNALPDDDQSFQKEISSFGVKKEVINAMDDKESLEYEEIAQKIKNLPGEIINKKTNLIVKILENINNLPQENKDLINKENLKTDLIVKIKEERLEAIPNLIELLKSESPSAINLSIKTIISFLGTYKTAVSIKNQSHRGNYALKILDEMEKNEIVKTLAVIINSVSEDNLREIIWNILPYLKQEDRIKILEKIQDPKRMILKKINEAIDKIPSSPREASTTKIWRKNIKELTQRITRKK